MEKKYWIILLVINIIVAGIIVGVLIAGKGKTSNLQPEIDTKLAKQNIEQNTQIIETSTVEQKTSPNSLFVFETCYKKCGHTTLERIEIPKECVNQTKEEIQEKYKDWQIKEFSLAELSFYKEQNEICKEHYVIRENNGYVAIYTIDELGKETLKETTEIVTTYLPETDKKRLQEGIKVVGQEKLNATIEDYE